VDAFDTTFRFNTVTALIGPRFGFGSGGVQPFVHLLVGPHFAWADNDNDLAMGGALGGGVDVEVGANLLLRAGADFQLFDNDSGSFKVLRLTAGLSRDM
jgi:hypothetical protein